MGASTTRVLIGLALLTLTGCSGSADPSPPPTTRSTPTSAAPSPTASPTVPVMPEAAKAHTKAGAKAFVRYFWQVVNYAQATGDTAAIRTLSARKCAECDAGMYAIDEVYGAGGSIGGGASTLANLRASVTRLAGLDYASVEYVNSIARTTFDLPGVDSDSSDPATTNMDRMRLGAAPGAAWKVLLFEAAS